MVQRNVRNGLLFTLAGWMAAPPAGDFSQLVFDASLSLAENMRTGSFPIPLNLTIGLQAALEALGFNPNELNGVFGSGTRTALTGFQKSNGLTQTPEAQTIDAVRAETMDTIAGQLDALQIEHFP